MPPPSTPWLPPVCLVNADNNNQLNVDTLAGICSCTKWHLCCVYTTYGSFLALFRKSWVVEKEAPWASVFFILWSRQSGLAVRKYILFTFFTCFLQDPLSSAVVLEVWRDGVLRVKYMELPRWGSFERTHVNLPRIFSTHHPQLVPRCCWSAASTDLALLSPQAPQPTQSWPAPASSPRLFLLAMSSLVLGASAIRSFNNHLNSGWFV